MNLCIILLIFTVLTGCAPTHYRNFAYPNYGQAEFEKDFRECARQNRAQAPSSKYAFGVFSGSVDDGPVYKDVNYGNFPQCLAGFGWRPVN
jgi:hypothetical protein